MADATFIPLTIAVMTISDTRTLAEDRSGDVLVRGLEEAGHELGERSIVKDDTYAIRALASRWIADEATQVILTTGGTGLTGRDGTPEAIRPLLDKVVDGFGELFRWLSFEEIGTSTIDSRALAGVANGTLVFCLPGSSGACRTAWERIIRPQIDVRQKPCNLAQLLPRMRET